MPEAIPQTKYEVAAYLRLRGDFSKQMMRAQRATGKMDRGFSRLARSAQMTGQRMMDGPVRAMGRMARITATLGAVGGAAGMGGLITGGLKFNKQMEDASLQLATMNQMFGIAEASSGKSATNAERWATNLTIAKLSMKEFLRLQAQSPLGAQQLVTLYTRASSGLAQASKNVSKHTNFIADWSVLVGALDGDVNQLGADLGRILTGQAGAEIRTWQIFKSQILVAAKESKKLGKNLQLGDSFIKQWNKKLSASERLEVLNKFIAKTGGELRKAFGESMGGLLSTSKATANTIAGVMTKPMYESFRKFLKKVNADVGGLFGASGIGEWKRMARFFGGILEKGATSMLSSFENGARHLKHNWESISDSVYKAFQLGAFLIKAVVARALFKLMAGAALGVAGGVGRVGSRAFGAAKRGGGFLGGQFRRSKTAVMRGFLGGRRHGFLSGAGGVRHGTGHGMGRAARGMGQKIFQAAGGLVKMVGGMSSLATLSTLLTTGMIMLATTMATLLTVVAPIVAIVAVLGVAFGVVGVIIAGMAVYIVENWRAISKSIHTAMKEGRTTIFATIVAAFKLWNGLSALGYMFLGNGKSVDVLNSVMNVMTSVINGITQSIIWFLEAGQMMASWFSTFASMMASIHGASEDLAKFGVRIGTQSTERAADIAAVAKEWRDSALAADEFNQKLGDIKRNFKHFGLKDLDTTDMTKAEAFMKKLTDFFGGDGPKQAKVPAAGVHVENMYNQWDLRNEDPDRLMAAFLPKIEALADKRTQSWETVAQGV